jgi:hypothetical protein
MVKPVMLPLACRTSIMVVPKPITVCSI